MDNNHWADKKNIDKLSKGLEKEPNTINPLIEASELLELYQNEKLVLIDSGNGEDARENYTKKHLDQALFVDLNTALADIKDDAANGGRHPLPPLKEFILVLNQLGIYLDSHVILYDDKYGANAATRFWWMLKAVGHKKVQVLNGGLHEAEKFGLPMNNTLVEPKLNKAYSASKWQLPLTNLKEVEQVSEDEDYLIIDVREAERFKGKFEPIDLVAGHIPGAINIPFSTNLDKTGHFLPQDVLKEKYSKVFKQIKAENISVHCGSGVTACHTLFAIAYSGLNIPKLYVGSWSEWSRNNKKIVKE